MIEMNKRSVLLTGATGGIGRALAERLAGQVDRLILTGRDPEELRIMGASLGAGVQSIHCDLQSPDSIRSLAETITREDACVDTLIHCAGAGSFGEFEHTDDDTIERVIDLNLIAPIKLTRALLPAMLARQQPRLVFVGSALGRLGYPGQAVYCASKAGLHRFAEALRREYFDCELGVLHIAPRATATAFNSLAQQAVNRELKVAEDPPGLVAEKIINAIQRDRNDTVIGFPEKLIARLNQLVPGFFDLALRSHTRAMRRHVSQLSSTGQRQ
ncbi:MAG: SDR family oxidoreductase [Wenzhouxiangellaceae bacterium]|nr:SDR family oxidoreductase [Wenzhouxiangellaceae bacterium]